VNRKLRNSQQANTASNFIVTFPHAIDTNQIKIHELQIPFSFDVISATRKNNILGIDWNSGNYSVTLRSGSPDGLEFTEELQTQLGTIDSGFSVSQLQNIATHEISETEWGNLASLNQNVSTTSSVTFANIITSGTVDGVDVSALETKVTDMEAAIPHFDQEVTITSSVTFQEVSTDSIKTTSNFTIEDTTNSETLMSYARADGLTLSTYNDAGINLNPSANVGVVRVTGDAAPPFIISKCIQWH